MGMEINWSQEFETGIDIIDEQHKRLFDYFHEIEQTIARDAPDEVAHLVRALIDYAISHNSFEEALMEKAGYPLFDAHRQVHKAFRERVMAWSDKLDQGADPLRIAREVRTDIGLWLINHIKREDKHYAPYVKKVMDQGLFTRLTRKIFGR